MLSSEELAQRKAEKRARPAMQEIYICHDNSHDRRILGIFKTHEQATESWNISIHKCAWTYEFKPVSVQVTEVRRIINGTDQGLDGTIQSYWLRDEVEHL